MTSSVRSSFRQLKRETESTKPTEGAAESTASRRPRRSRQRPPAGETDTSGRLASGPVGRKWRDAVASNDAPGYADSYEDDDRDDDEAADGPPRFDIGGWFRQTFFDGDRPNWKLWATIATIAVIILLLLWSQLRGDGGGNDDDPTPSPTTENVISPDRTSTPATQVSTSPDQTEEPTLQATATPDSFPGGDNQRD